METSGGISIALPAKTSLLPPAAAAVRLPLPLPLPPQLHPFASRTPATEFLFKKMMRG
jgi:hypothetical protein